MGEETAKGKAIYLDKGKELGYEKSSKLLREVLISRNCFWRGQKDIKRELKTPTSHKLENVIEYLKGQRGGNRILKL